MGAISNLITTGRTGTALINTTRAGSLDAATVMAAQPGQITPDNPGNWQHLSVPIPAKAQQFSATESQRILSAAAEAKAKETITVQTYAAIRQMSGSLRRANVAHEQTRRVVAADTCVSATEKATSAGLLHELRPVYAAAQRKLDGHKARAQGAIKAYA